MKFKQEIARQLEQRCLQTLNRFDRGEATIEESLGCLSDYEQVFNGDTDHTEVYRRVLEDRPWKKCGCEICERLGIHIIIFRGAERNRRRGFHNLYVFNQQLQGHLQRGGCASLREGSGELSK